MLLLKDKNVLSQIRSIDDLQGLFESPCYIRDGVYFSKNAPIVIENRLKEDLEFNTDTDFISLPYETDTVIIWKGERPVKMDYEGQANYGASLSAKVDEPGYITVCMQND